MAARSAKEKKKEKDRDAALNKLGRRLAKLDLEIKQMRQQLRMYPLCHRGG
jgi:hypothetical protein